MGPVGKESCLDTVVTESSVLDKKQMRIFQYPLTTSQQMWVGFLIPTCISTVIFLAKFALDIAVIYQLSQDGHHLLASVALVLVYAPPVICLILSLLCLPKLERRSDLVCWIIIQILQTLMFPVGIMHRFASRLFWSIVALTENDPQREEALHIAATNHQTELLFFLNSFINAGPQAVLQAFILLSPQIATTRETAWTQVVCIITSVTALSETAALYQRFESQRVVGRPVPWDVTENRSHSRALVNFKKFDPLLLMGLHEHKSPKQAEPPQLIVTSENQETNMINMQENDQTSESLGSFQIQPEAHMETEVEEGKFTKEAQQPSDSTGESTKITHEAETVHSYLNKKELAFQNRQNEGEIEPQERDSLLQNASIQESLDDEVQDSQSHYLQPIRVDSVAPEDRCFWPRIDVLPTTPAADPHMRPRLSINTIRSQNRPAYLSQVRFPVRKPRTKGLCEDEPLGIFTVFNAWVSYLTARVLVIAAFTHFYLWPSLGIILSHYAIMVTYLSICSPCGNYWAPLLGFMFILCPVEVKIRFKHPKVFLIFFFALVFFEDLSTVVLWYCGTVWESWWYDLTFYVIIGGHCTAALNASLYLCLFRTKVKYVS